LANLLANNLEIHPSSVLSNLKPKYVLYNELIVVGNGQRRLMTDVSTIEREWLFEVVPNGFYRDITKQIAL